MDDKNVAGAGNRQRIPRRGRRRKSGQRISARLSDGGAPKQVSEITIQCLGLGWFQSKQLDGHIELTGALSVSSTGIEKWTPSLV